MTISVEIRRARVGNVEAIYKLVNFYARRGKLLKRSKGNIRKDIRNFFVALRDEQVVGCACLAIYSRKMAEVISLAVLPSESGKGIGKLLVDRCVAKCRKRRVLELMAITSQEKFFKDLGFDYVLPGERKALFVKP